MNLPAFRPGATAGEADIALRQSLRVLDQAQHGAVVWFGDVMQRGLFRELGYSTMRAYALDRLGFSATRAGDFIRLAQRLEHLPAVKAKVASGEMGYTKARAIATVADPTTEQLWLEAAQTQSRRELEVTVQRARQEARQRGAAPGQQELLPASQPTAPAAAVPVRIGFDLTPIQYARYEALLARIGHRDGPAELLLEMAAALAEQTGPADRAEQGEHVGHVGHVEQVGQVGHVEHVEHVEQVEQTGQVGQTGQTEQAARITPRPKIAPRGATRATAAPPHQIHLHECPTCAAATVQTPRGELSIGRAAAETARCDAIIHQPGQRRTATIPPRVRREVLARDRHRCRRRGCHHTRHLHLHHITPRAVGGGHEPENLVTLCPACHALWHERGGDLRPLLAEIPGAED